MTGFLEIQDVKKTLDEKIILKNINLDVKKGEIIAMVGPSGSGKSTLLRCLNRLTEIDQGQIRLDGEDINKISPIILRRTINLVHQESVMLTGTVYDNVAYGPSLFEIINKNHIIKCLEDVGLNLNYFEKDASKLSGGEKKRVALARSLALKPEILMLDEPTSGIDPKNIEMVEKNIVNFSKERKLTVIWVTHYVEQAKRVSSRIANLKDGEIKKVMKTSEFQWEGVY